MPARGVFVTGTDTDVGKTVVAVGIVRALVRRGIPVAAYKPVEAGGHTDAELLWEASGRLGPLEDTCRVRLSLAAAPAVGAREEGKKIRADDLLAGYVTQSEKASVVVVEGAGGLLVPLARGLLVADLAKAIGLPVLVVARDCLGTINHTLLTVEAARSRGLTVAGVVMNRAWGDADPTTRTNQDLIAALLPGIPVLGPLPRLDPFTIEAAADAVLELGLGMG